MDLNILVVEESRKCRIRLNNILLKCYSKAHVAEALDGSIALRKFDNQKLDLLIVNVDVKKYTAFNLVKELLSSGKISKENIVFVYETIDQNQIKELLPLGITDIVSYSSSDELLGQRLSLKLANSLKYKLAKKAA
jgi:PleD family two-component response regulator